MHIVAALGGNALLRRGEALTQAAQQENLRHAAMQLAVLVEQGHRLTLTHGNGPQVGLLALQAAAGPPGAAQPLDSLDAESEGWIGYMLEQELANALPAEKQIATLLTRMEVAPDDPAFAKPSKPIGPVYDEATAKRLAAERVWSVAPDGQYWRRVVPSPMPKRLLNAGAVTCLVNADILVICAGGGGIPVMRDATGKWRGVEAVIDKDASATLLAEQIGADLLLLLTDVPAVCLHYGTPAQTALREATPTELRAHDFAAGSMGPKVQAACAFVQATGRRAAIGRLEDAAALAAGTAGTQIHPPRSG